MGAASLLDLFDTVEVPNLLSKGIASTVLAKELNMVNITNRNLVFTALGHGRIRVTPMAY